MKKTCTCCRQLKDISEFYLKNKNNPVPRSYCIQCHAEKRKKHYEENKNIYAEKQRIYRQENLETCSKRSKEYYKNNKEHHNKITKNYYEKNIEHVSKQYAEYREKNRQKIRDRYKEYYQKNKKKINKKNLEYRKNRYKTDPIYKLHSDISRRIRKALKNNKELKSKSTIEYLGCDLDFLRNHIETQFREGMNWDVFFIGEIHIDHIRPCASFDLTDPEQQKTCFHYSNLQPLWAKENHEKRDKLNYRIAV